MRMRMRFPVAIAAIAVAAAACGGSGGSGGGGGGGGQSTSAEGGSFSIAIGEPHSLFPPSTCYASECTAVINQLWTGLVEMENGKLVDRVAKSITSKDQKTWDIKLKQGWKFHNGEPVDADSFIRAWNWAAYAPNGASTAGFFTRFNGADALTGKHPKSKELSGLQKVSDYEFTATLSAPFSQFPYMLLYTPAFAPVTKECMSKIKQCNAKPIGDGPFEMSGKWQHNEQIVVKKAPDYKGQDAAHADQVTFKIYQKMETGFRDWQAGNLDIIAPVPSQVPQARKAAGDRTTGGKTSDFTYIGLPLYLNYLKDPKIRHALSLAIDRKAIIKNLLAGLGVPAQSVVSPIVPGGGGDHCDYCQYDPKRAKQLAKEAGGLPKTIDIWVNSGAGNDEWVQAVGDQWKNTFGVDYKIKSLQFPEYLDTLNKAKGTGPYRLGWIMDFPSMVNYLKPIYFTHAPTNYSRYSNKTFENLVNKGSASESQDQAIKYYSKAEDMLIEDMPVIPVYYGKAFYVYSSHVQNVNYDPLYRIDVSKVTVAQ